MALNFTVSYTFSPSTTISSSQVNTNTSDVAAVFQGLEAETKTLAKLKVDIDPTLALEVATKQYVDHYSIYRRPVLQYASSTVVYMETGVNGVSGQAQILFPDGTLRTDSTSGRINCNMAQNAILSGSAQSGIRAGSVVDPSWYCFYAVKVSDNSANFVHVADTVIPITANFATLNANFGTNSWVYLGTLPYSSGIFKFVMSGNRVAFYNVLGGNADNLHGILLATTASATSLTYTYAAGTNLGSYQVPAHIPLGDFLVAIGSTTGFAIHDSANTSELFRLGSIATAPAVVPIPNCVISAGVKVLPSGATMLDIAMSAFQDSVLGIGSNPLL